MNKKKSEFLLKHGEGLKLELKENFDSKNFWKVLITGILLISLIGLIFFVSALTPEEELEQLGQELTDSGYGFHLNLGGYVSNDNYMLSSDNKILTY